MNNASRAKVAVQVATTRLTKEQQDLLSLVTLRERLPVGEVADSVQDVRVLLSEGLLRLTTIIYPWGLDFELEPANDGGSEIGGPGA